MDKVKEIMNRWNALQPLSDRDKEMLSRRFIIDFNYNSNHIEGNTLTYGQTEILLLFGKIVGEADVKDVQEMTASNIGLKMMQEEARMKDIPLTQNFIRMLHKTLLREDYTVYRNLPGGGTTSYGADTTSRILNLMYEFPDITIPRLSQEVGINMNAVNKQIKQLTEKEYIQRAEKSGNWRLIITPSIAW